MPYAAALVHERFLERFDIENISTLCADFS